MLIHRESFREVVASVCIIYICIIATDSSAQLTQNSRVLVEYLPDDDLNIQPESLSFSPVFSIHQRRNADCSSLKACVSILVQAEHHPRLGVFQFMRCSQLMIWRESKSRIVPRVAVYKDKVDPLRLQIVEPILNQRLSDSRTLKSCGHKAW